MNPGSCFSIDVQYINHHDLQGHIDVGGIHSGGLRHALLGREFFLAKEKSDIIPIE
jgi:hypothetical protein